MSKLAEVRVAVTRYGNRKLRDSRAARRMAINAYRLAAEANRFLPPPRMLLNGHSKSGTHLLSDCVALMPKTAYCGRHFTMEEFHRSGCEPWLEAFSHHRPRPAIDGDKLRRYLRRCPHGMFATAHARHSAELRAALSELGYAHVLLLRDPRDMVVSHAKFVMASPTHPDHRFYQGLGSDDRRLLATIEGYDRDQATGTAPRPSIGESMAGYLDWLDQPEIHVTRFEDLVGPRGGGSAETQHREIVRLAAFLQRPLSDDHAAQVGERMYSRASMTFRKGATGDWEQHFGPAHREAFARVAGDLLVRLGYERDHLW